MTFTTTRLAAGRTLVEGTDVRGNTGQLTVSHVEWDELTARSRNSEALESFDAKVEEFFAPLTAAADELNDALAKASAPDPLTYMTLREASEGAEAVSEIVRELSFDSIILRAIATEQSHRLIWVGDELVLTEAVEEPEDEDEDEVVTDLEPVGDSES